ncbi:MAG: glycosyl hydrolase [Bacteroidota bacterium]
MRFQPIILSLYLTFLFISCGHVNIEVTWPEIQTESKPWVRWWWMGNGVDKAGITAQLEAFAGAGIGGVEIAPIYGVKGEEDRFIDFLSPEWMEMLKHTTTEAERLGMKVDMTQGTGWPFGGPYVPKEEGAGRLLIEQYELSKGEKLTKPIIAYDRRGEPLDASLVILTAYGSNDQVVDLIGNVDESGNLNWVAPEGSWNLIAGFNGKTGQRVKRAAPGGSGYVVDHLSKEAVDTYLSRFNSAFSTGDYPVRAMFNDSYEVYNADWTPEFLEEFQTRRGYDLKPFIKELISEEDTDTSRRLKSDYRETMSELLQESFTNQWVEWAHDHKMLVKNQAHGSPANLLDLYGTVDIPEIETFGSTQFDIPGLRYEKEFLSTREPPDPYMLKFASSAAHVMGKPLTSSESLTWLAEHFRTPLSLAKPELDQLFLSGINHVFFHGSAYSPEDYPWPGWLFYASVHFGPTNSFWQDLGAMDQYIARCQAVFQSAKPDNELLVYWPIYDIWDDPEQRSLYQLTVHNISEWLIPTPFYQLNEELHKGGWQTDYISDNQLSMASAQDGQLKLPGSDYKVLLVPSLRNVPVATMKKIVSLAEAGATVIFQNLDFDVPGLNSYKERNQELEDLVKAMNFNQIDGIEVAEIGAGKIIVEDEVEKALTWLKVSGESISQSGLRYMRMKDELGKYYFLVNLSPQIVDKEISFNSTFNTAVLMDPISGKIGKVDVHLGKVQIKLKPGESIILRTIESASAANPERPGLKEGKPLIIEGSWEVSAVRGGPKLPEPFTTNSLTSWTNQDSSWEYFSGTAKYNTVMELDDKTSSDYLLRFDQLGESASIYVNGDSVGTIWSVPTEIAVGDYLKTGKNEIEILVTNLMANRIRYMDMKGIEWRKFHEINFVNIDYKPFDASVWQPMPSGIIGKVELIPLTRSTVSE